MECLAQRLRFLCDNRLYLFHIKESKLYSLIQFAAKPDRLFFHEGYCSAVIGKHVWLFDGNTGYLAAPLFEVGLVESIRLAPNQNIVFTMNNQEERWRWQNPYSHSQSRMISTTVKQSHSIDISPNGSIWLLHDDDKLTIIGPNAENFEIF